jgi:radical SAM family uncharacterized protein
MEAEMRHNHRPLYGLESYHPAVDFDIIGFSLQYELNYTNVINMLNLSGMPIKSAERDERWPLVIAGGTCALNPEPMSEFIDLFVLGDGEETLQELLASYRRDNTRDSVLRHLANIEGTYIPRYYDVFYLPDGTIAEIRPMYSAIPSRPKRRIVTKLPKPPIKPVVPFVEAVHDRAMVEVMRGCSHGCRFCQAGVIYRPVRERSTQDVLNAAQLLIANTGYDELGLISLSSSDYTYIQTAIEDLKARYPDLRVSLPSLRADTFSVGLAEAVSGKKNTITFAPEAGSARLRRVINKDITQDDLLRATELAFQRGWKALKLYFMIGLPGENDDDIEEIVHTVRVVENLARRYGRRQVGLTVSTFIPKPHTPFQWVSLMENIGDRQEFLQKNLRKHKLGWSDPQAGKLEATLARGDRRLGKVIERAWEQGARFDAWSEHFLPSAWERAFSQCDIDPSFFATRQRGDTEVFPWDHLDIGVTKRFLWREYEKSKTAETTPDCRNGECSSCGLALRHPACAARIDNDP